jgi:hypothetical protein
MAFPTKVEQDQKIRSAEYNRAREAGLAAIFAAYPIMPRHQANELMVEEICAAYLGVNYLTDAPAPTLAVFRSAVEADPSILGNGVAIEPVAAQKIKIMAEIEELLMGAMSPFDLKIELGKLKYQSKDQLIARRNQIIERQRLSRLSSSEIRAEIKASRPQPQRFEGYATLPSEFDAKYLRGLTAFEFRRAIAKYSSPQIDARLRGEI